MPPWEVRGQKYGQRDRQLESRVSQLALGRALRPAATTSRGSLPPGQTGLPRVLEHCAHHTWAPPKTTLWGVAEIAMVYLVPAPQTSETTQKTRDWRLGRLSTSLQVAVTASPLASLPPASLSYPSTHQLSQGPFQPANPTMSPYSLQLPLGFLQPASQGCPPHWASAPLPTVPLNMLPPGHTKGLSHCCAFAHAIPFHWLSSFKAHLKCHLLQAALPDSLVLSLGLHSTF